MFVLIISKENLIVQVAQQEYLVLLEIQENQREMNDVNDQLLHHMK